MSIKQTKILGLAALLLLTAPVSGGAKIPENNGISNWSALLPHPLEENKFLAAAQNTIYVTAPEFKEKWQKWSSLPVNGLKIQKLLYFPQVPENVFILSERGIYKTSLTPKGYETVYEKRKVHEKITDFAVHPQDLKRLFVGTSSGVLESKDAGLSWHLFTPTEKQPVCFLRFSGTRFFVAHTDSLWESDNLSFFRKVFSMPGSENAESESSSPESPSEPQDTEASAASCGLRDFTDSENQDRFWLATERGMFETRDSGLSWTSSNGLAVQDIHFLTRDFKSKKIFAAGRDQIHGLSLEENRWHKIPLHTAGSPIQGISASGGNLKVVTAAGLMTHVILPDRVRLPELDISGVSGPFQELLRLEPTALQVQRVVSNYHHTQNSKIDRWQAESRIRALLPTVSFKKDFSLGNNIDIDRRGTNDPDTFIEGPADTSRGWDFGVAWDLGDLIFSTSQTSIDSREKLMMELRHDLTAAATRLFYERRRLQLEIFLNPAPSESEHLQRLMQIDELTALLDAMTNGFMSRQIELIHKEHPEFENIWRYSPPTVRADSISPRADAPAVRTPR